MKDLKKEEEGKMRGIFLISTGVLWLCCLLAGCHECGKSTAHIPSVTNFDPERYAGIWYEIARLPNWFEREMSDVQAEYTLRPDGTINVVNRGIRDGQEKETRGIARKDESYPPSVGELEVSFFRPFYGKYRIIYLNDDSTVAMVTSGTMDYFWILSRTPDLPGNTKNELLRMAESWGFPVDKLEYPRHMTPHPGSGQGKISSREAPSNHAKPSAL